MQGSVDDILLMACRGPDCGTHCPSGVPRSQTSALTVEFWRFPPQAGRLQTWTVSGLSPSHCPRLLALVLHTTCRCWMPSPQVAEHWDQAPSRHWAGQGTRRQGRRASGRSPGQALAGMTLWVPLERGSRHCVPRVCTPSFPQLRLQAPHSSITHVGWEHRC